jgi:phosphinothricin acetyltransferase
LEVREAEERDLEPLNELYNHYVRTSPCTFDIEPISMDARRKWFEQLGGRYRLVVGTEGPRLLGYAYSGPLRERRAYETSVATTIYVAHGQHGKGIGTTLYSALFDVIADEDLHRAYAGITMPNATSVALHERFGFIQVAYFTEQGRKFDKYWDVAWYEKAL